MASFRHSWIAQGIFFGALIAAVPASAAWRSPPEDMASRTPAPAPAAAVHLVSGWPASASPSLPAQLPSPTDLPRLTGASQAGSRRAVELENPWTGDQARFAFARRSHLDDFNPWTGEHIEPVRHQFTFRAPARRAPRHIDRGNPFTYEELEVYGDPALEKALHDLESTGFALR